VFDAQSPATGLFRPLGLWRYEAVFTLPPEPAWVPEPFLVETTHAQSN